MLWLRPILLKFRKSFEKVGPQYYYQMEHIRTMGECSILHIRPIKSLQLQQGLGLRTILSMMMAVALILVLVGVGERVICATVRVLSVRKI